MAECEFKEVHDRLFRGLLERTLSNADVAELIRILLNFAYKEVGRRINGRYWRTDRVGLTQWDVANDSMARLLAWDGRKYCERLKRSLAVISECLHESGSFCSYVHDIVNRCVRQEFYRILSEDNSTRTNLLRALDRHRRNSPELKYRDSAYGFVYSLVGIDVLKAQPFMPAELLFRLILHHLPINGERDTGSNGGHPTNPVVHVLNACLSILADQEDYRREVPERDVLQYTKMWLAAVYESGEGETSVHGIPERYENELRAGIEAALDTTGAWVGTSYVGKGKLAMPVAEAMLGAILEWSYDCLDETAEEPAVYFRMNEGMSSAEYRASYRSVFMNILKGFKDELRGAWR